MGKRTIAGVEILSAGEGQWGGFSLGGAGTEAEFMAQMLVGEEIKIIGLLLLSFS